MKRKDLLICIYVDVRSVCRKCSGAVRLNTQWRRKNSNRDYLLSEGLTVQIRNSLLNFRSACWWIKGRSWYVLRLIWDLCTGSAAVFLGSKRNDDKETSVVSVKCLRFMKYGQKVRVWLWAMCVDEEGAVADLYLCLFEICVQKVQRFCAAHNATEMKKDDSWALRCWRSWSRSEKQAFEFKRCVLMKRKNVLIFIRVHFRSVCRKCSGTVRLKTQWKCRKINHECWAFKDLRVRIGSAHLN